MASNDLSDRVAAVKEVTALFKVERVVYICIIVVCLLILLGSVAVGLIRGEMGYAEVTSIFGSGGTVALLCGRLIHMWNRTMSLLGAPAEN